ncbi:SLC13 family permease [Vandammella animalimorsus]|uniref:SLC13 family permease n=1 Tax=Vandammella animalimorsus TaxID=2029117 RepID=A0A3M6RA07_9BURK|nr:SLC13 family permease [Vandammella animalimorsus]RMX11938.1 SLC13 family permease [Vandammella animalimorsus]
MPISAREPGLPLAAWVSGVLLLLFVAWVLVSAFGAGAILPGTPALQGALPAQGALTLCVFAIAIWLWMFSSVDDTYVALGAATALVMMGVVRDSDLFVSLGEDTVWLLLGAFLIAAGVSASGLATRVAAFVVTGARSPAQLAHLCTAALVATAFMVPATSGRAALTLPVFVALAGVLSDRPALVRALALLFPSVILLSAVASYLGAGAHLITNQILQAADMPGFSFASWLKFGLPLAVLASHACAVLILWLFVPQDERRQPLRVTVADMQAHADTPLSGPLLKGQGRAASLVGLAMLLWCTEPLHGLHPAMVALACGLVMTHPTVGAVSLTKALKSVPWSLLMFMAATLTLGTALVKSGAADWLAAQTLGQLRGTGRLAALGFLVAVVLLSTAAHLVIQSRSARSAVLIPIVIALAPGVGVSPTAAAMASTAAAGFCHTLTSSAKPMTLYAHVSGTPTYAPADLLRMSAWLAPLSALLVLLFALLLWPALGLPVLVAP